jgi:alpha-N-arabinofuranosidase
MTDLREKNGRTKPWRVKFWGIGNEAWGCGGNMTAEHYANVYRQYATFMTNWNNSDRIFRIASGASGDDYHWTEVLMRDIPLGMLDGVALHHYSVIDWNRKSSATNFTEDQYFKTMQQASLMDEYIRKHTEIMDKYDTRKKVALVVDEWGGWYDVEPGTNGAFLYQQNTMRDAMIAGLTLNIFNNHCDRVRMANLAQCINVLQAVILTNEEKIILTPTYHVMEMYNVHQDAALIPADVNSNDYTSGDKKLKAISASASRDKNGAVHISITNIDAKNPQDVSIDLGGIQVKSITGRILRSGKLQDYNSFEDPNKIKPSVFNDAHLAAASVTLRVPAFSVVVLELK